MMRLKRLVILFVFLICSCKGETMPQTRTTIKDIKDVPPSAWEGLAKKRILFGHQSVGDNIVEGMADLMKDHPTIRLTIKQTTKPDDIVPGTFAHFPVGENGKPDSKIRDFADKIRRGMGEKVDIALFKFCFVDINADTDVERLFQSYRETMESLKKEYPSVTFAHVTVPLLREEKPGIKGLIGRLTGRSGGFFDDRHNIKRNEYNEFIRRCYTGKEPVFDIAAVESSRPDGKQVTFSSGGRKYPALAPEYTEDGGHLNALGRRVVAAQFLGFLAGLR
jgi:hypothetical protein